jgi:hypothetical protein
MRTSHPGDRAQRVAIVAVCLLPEAFGHSPWPRDLLSRVPSLKMHKGKRKARKQLLKIVSSAPEAKIRRRVKLHALIKFGIYVSSSD